MHRFVGTCVAALVIAWSSPASASLLIDFQGLGLNEGDALTNQIPGVTFENTIVAKFDGPASSTPAANVFGFRAGDANTGTFDGVSGTNPPSGPFATTENWFITDQLGSTTPNPWAYDPGTDITMVFDSPVGNVSFLIADLDGTDAVPEILTVTAFDTLGNPFPNPVTAQNGAAGDDAVTTISLPYSGIKKLVFDVSGTTAGVFAFGIDNIQFTIIPEPLSAGVWALLAWASIGKLGRTRR